MKMADPGETSTRLGFAGLAESSLLRRVIRDSKSGLSGLVPPQNYSIVMTMAKNPHPIPLPPDMHETGAPIEGEVQQLDRRLYIQLLAFTDTEEPRDIVDCLSRTNLEAVVYANASDPAGIAVLFVAEDPADLIEPLRRVHRECLSKLTPIPELTMIGRSYGAGREPDLEDWLLRQPRRRLTDPDRPWAIWYPLRRKPAFYQLEPRERGMILAEHGMLGRSYGEAGLAQDIRLKCFGLDRNDNEFLIGLIGSELNALSRLVEDMRETQQTAQHLDSLGPFFVGHRIGSVNIET